MTTDNENETSARSTAGQSNPASTPEPGAPAASHSRRGASTALTVTAIAVGSALLLGLTFGGGVLTGTLLADRGPGSGMNASAAVDRLHDRLDDLRDLRDDRQDRRDDRRDDRQDLRDERPGPGFGVDQPPAESTPQD